jgi:hypothetical protein
MERFPFHSLHTLAAVTEVACPCRDGQLAPRAGAELAALGLQKAKVFHVRGGFAGPKGWQVRERFALYTARCQEGPRKRSSSCAAARLGSSP